VCGKLQPSDCELLINSHWESGTKAGLVAFRTYVEDLTAQVAAGIRAGRSKEDLQKSTTLEKHSSYAGYPDRYRR